MITMRKIIQFIKLTFFKMCLRDAQIITKDGMTKSIKVMRFFRMKVHQNTF